MDSVTKRSHTSYVTDGRLLKSWVTVGGHSNLHVSSMSFGESPFRYPARGPTCVDILISAIILTDQLVGFQAMYVGTP